MLWPTSASLILASFVSLFLQVGASPALATERPLARCRLEFTFDLRNLPSPAPRILRGSGLITCLEGLESSRDEVAIYTEFHAPQGRTGEANLIQGVVEAINPDLTVAKFLRTLVESPSLTTGGALPLEHDFTLMISSGQIPTGLLQHGMSRWIFRLSEQRLVWNINQVLVNPLCLAELQPRSENQLFFNCVNWRAR